MVENRPNFHIYSRRQNINSSKCVWIGEAGGWDRDLLDRYILASVTLNIWLTTPFFFLFFFMFLGNCLYSHGQAVFIIQNLSDFHCTAETGISLGVRGGYIDEWKQKYPIIFLYFLTLESVCVNIKALMIDIWIYCVAHFVVTLPHYLMH